MNLQGSIKITRNPLTFSKKYQDKWIILDQKNGSIRELNELAGFIWDLFENPHSINEIVTEITKNFSVSEETAKLDVTEFVNSYLNSKFLTKA